MNELMPYIGIYWLNEAKTEIFESFKEYIDSKDTDFLSNDSISIDLAERWSHSSVWDRINIDEFKYSDYTCLPRGRVLFRKMSYMGKPEDSFIILSNKLWWNSEIEELIIKEFQLENENYYFEHDEHYNIITQFLI